MQLQIKKLHEDAIMPKKGLSDSFIDLNAYLPNCQAIVKPKEKVVIGTGISVSIPISFLGVILTTSEHTFNSYTRISYIMDSDYSGELQVCLYNDSNNKTLYISHGNVIAKLAIIPCAIVDIKEVEDM